MQDSMLVVNQSIAQQSVRREFAGEGVTRLLAVSFSSAVGLLAGAIIWGASTLCSAASHADLLLSGIFGDLIVWFDLHRRLDLSYVKCSGSQVGFQYFCESLATVSKGRSHGAFSSFSVLSLLCLRASSIVFFSYYD